MTDRETEIELYGELGLPVWSPVSAKVGGKLRRMWIKRVELVNAEICESAAITQDEFEERIVESDEIADIYRRAAERAGTVADAEYRGALARLVGAAFADNARIHEIDDLTSQLVKLDPIHLRVLRASFPTEPGVHIGSPYVSPMTLTLELGLDQESTALAALKALESGGFMIQAPDPEQPTGQDLQVAHSYRATWTATQWGLRAMVLCSAAGTAD